MDVLYKYLTPELVHVLETNSLKCSAHTEFNDLFDSYHIAEPEKGELNPLGSPNYYISFEQASDPLRREKNTAELKDWFERSSAKYPGFQLRSVSIMEANGMQAEFARRAYLSSKKDPLLLCLSESATTPLMWENFAAGSKGFCVGFKTSASFLRDVKQIQYSETPSSGLEIVGQWRRWLVKETRYTHEREWRVQYPEQATQVIQIDETRTIRTVRFDQNDIAHVIVGARSEPSLIERIRVATGGGVRIGRIRPTFEAFDVDWSALAENQGGPATP